VLDNGLRLLVVEDHSSPTFAYQTWFRVGSRDEVPGKTGLAHLFEHMMFKGTKTRKEGEFDRLLERAGAEGENAFTSRDFTAYVQELPSKQLELIAQAEADRMVHLVVNQNSFRTEREVVQNERRFRTDNHPDGMMEEALFQMAFEKHAYHWPIIGYEEDLKKMTEVDARHFYERFYAPQQATVIVVGDVSPSQVHRVVEKHYGKLAGGKPVVSISVQEPEQKKARHKQLALNIQVEKVLMGYPIPSVHHADAAILSVVQAVLTGGKSSRLNLALVETGVAIGVDADGATSKDPSIFVIAANLQKGQKAKHAEEILLKELHLLGEEGISEEELQRAKNRIKFDFYHRLGSNTDKAYFLGTYESIAGDFQAGIRLHEAMEKVNVADLKRVMKRYFLPQNRSVVVGVKK
jgi:predicted Zn-dependent peptidase